MIGTYESLRPAIVALQEQLQARADPKIKAWWEGYVKDSAPFLGVKMPVIRSLVHQWYQEPVATLLSGEGQIAVADLDEHLQLELALALIREDHTEEKLAGTLVMQEILLPAGALHCDRDLDRLGDLFAHGHIYDWNACDWFCVKVLGSLIASEGVSCATRIAAWCTAENLWQARSSLVPFVNVAQNSTYYPLIEASCRTVIRREERFAKTAVGWILRDISKYDKPFVERVVAENLGVFSRESLNNAIKYFDPEIRQAYLRRWKDAC